MSQPSKPTFELSPRRRELLNALLKAKGLDATVDRRIGRASRSEPIPLSFAQERLWFLDRFQPGGSVYNIPRAVPIAGPLDATALGRALNEIVRRHEALRTTFEMRGGRPVQVITPALSLRLQVVDLRGRPAAERAAEASRIAAEDLTRPFNLSRGPLLRAKIVQLSDLDALLLLTVHHIVSDGRSMEVLVSELSTLYRAFSEGRPSPLSELPTQYADFAIWQRASLTGEELERQLVYWKAHLAGAPRVIDLPVDRPRPAVQSFSGALQPFTIAPALAEELSNLSHHEGATLFMTVLSAFSVLLFRYTQQTKIVVGTPFANRNHAEIEGLIGFFVNTLVLCVDVDGDPTFRELIARVREVALGAYAHPDLPFEKLVEELQPERNLGHNPLFQVMFTVQAVSAANAPGEAVPAGTAAEDDGPIEIVESAAKFDVNLSFIQAPQSLTGAIEYNTDLFDHATISRWIARLKELLATVVAAPDRRISELPVLTANERRQIAKWNDRPMPYPDQRGVHALFEAQVERTPDAIAVELDGRRLTYRQLDARANQIAHHLRSLDVGLEAPVGLFLDRSPDMIAALLGVLKADGVHLPLDPTYPAKRLSFMIDDARAPVLLTEERLRDRAPRTAARVVSLDAEAEAIERQPTHAPPSRVRPDNLAYLIYTSGSTGQPKGVAVEHRTLLNLITWQIASSQLPEGATTLQYAAMSFDVSLQEVFATLCAGGTLALISEDDRRDVGKLLARLSGAAVARLFVPYIALQYLAESITSIELLPTSLRQVITAGEQLHMTPAIRALFERLPGVTLCNQYGPSETHVVSELSLSGSPRDWPALPPIGWPIANTHLYVLDARRRLAPIGVPGELFVGGAPLARGYLRRPEVTAERFVMSPFDPAARLYATGDMARVLNSGAIEFLGRADHQVKIRGYRVEIGEIEASLSEHPKVREVAVAVRTDGSSDKRLIAYLTSSHAPSIGELKEFLRERLPDYMVPSAFVVMDALPLTPSGKIDRLCLPAPDAERPALDRAFEPPETAVEKELAAIWSAVLHARRVGLHDNFFDLGGHSLSATQVVSRVREAFAVDVPLIRFFETPTIAELVLTILEAQLERVDEEPAERLLAEVEALDALEAASLDAAEA